MSDQYDQEWDAEQEQHWKAEEKYGMKSTPAKSWEERFDKRYLIHMKDGKGIRPNLERLNIADIKSFISTIVIPQAKEEAREEVIRQLDNIKNDPKIGLMDEITAGYIRSIVDNVIEFIRDANSLTPDQSKEEEK